MNREEAISIMNVIVHMLEPQYDTDRIEEAVNIAIKALEQEPKCRDFVSRDYLLSIANKDGAYGYVSAHEIINAPSVNPQKIGHWIRTYGNVKCSVCGSVKDSREVGKATHYCDFCGAKMIEPQESEEV